MYRLVVDPTSASLRECIQACAVLGRPPACITSAQEQAEAVTAANGTAVWLGNVRGSDGSTLCADDNESEFFYWATGARQPNDPRWLDAASAVEMLEGCIVLDGAGAQWSDTACAERSGSAACLCGAAHVDPPVLAAAYNTTLNDHEAEEAIARAEDDAQERIALIAIAPTFLGTAIVVWLMHTAILSTLNARRTTKARRAFPTSEEIVPSAGGGGRAADAVAGDESEASDALAAKAAATLEAAADAAQRVRKSINAAANAIAIVGAVCIPTGITVLATGHAMAPFSFFCVFGMAVGAVAGADPSLPRNFRAELHGNLQGAGVAIGGFAALFIYFTLSPWSLACGSKRDPECAMVGWYFSVFWMGNVLPNLFNSTLLIPAFLVSSERTFPRVAELVQQQKKLVADGAITVSCKYRNDKMYYLEGVPG